MKLIYSILIMLSALINVKAFAQSNQQSSPPPLKSFTDLEQPTEQTISVQGLLSFLPDVLVFYGKNSTITKDRIINEMGMGLKIAVQQGRKLTRDEVITIVKQLVDAVINLDMMMELATADGYLKNIEEANKELQKLKSELGKTEYQAMLQMQGLTEESFLQRAGKKYMIDRWIEEKVMKQISITNEDINEFYTVNQNKFTHKQTGSIPLDDELKSMIGKRLKQEKVAGYLKSVRENWLRENNVTLNF